MEHSNTLIVGAGVAGLTLAALLWQRGEEPVIIEKQSRQAFQEAGYMLGLLPLGGRVINALGKRKEYLSQSCSMQEYTLYDSNGRKLNTYSFAQINDRFGPCRGISRIKLIEILREAGEAIPIHFNSVVQDITQDETGVIVSFNNKPTRKFNLTVIADGVHSQTKSYLLNDQEFTYKSTGWGGWVSWIDSVPGFQNSYNEFWGGGFFMGMYPVKDQIGAFLGGPVKRLNETGRHAFAKEVQSTIHHPIIPVQQALQSFEELEDPYFWDLHDCKTERWRKGRVVLLGDAATGFLPTAGIGASMAMDSAAALDDELSRANKNHLDYALELYENRQREKAEKAQKESRKLGRWMFVDSPLTAWMRNKMLNFYSLDMMLRGFEKIMLGK